jgi:hypothetical protein
MSGPIPPETVMIRPSLITTGLRISVNKWS